MSRLNGNYNDCCNSFFSNFWTKAGSPNKGWQLLNINLTRLVCTDWLMICRATRGLYSRWPARTGRPPRRWDSSPSAAGPVQRPPSRTFRWDDLWWSALVPPPHQNSRTWCFKNLKKWIFSTLWVCYHQFNRLQVSVLITNKLGVLCKGERTRPETLFCYSKEWGSTRTSRRPSGWSLPSPTLRSASPSKWSTPAQSPSNLSCTLSQDVSSTNTPLCLLSGLEHPTGTFTQDAHCLIFTVWMSS